jgi:Flp pilus assembly pilin Flp
MRDQGQGLVEYALIVALIAIVALVALLFMGTQISSILSAIAERI